MTKLMTQRFSAGLIVSVLILELSAPILPIQDPFSTNPQTQFESAGKTNILGTDHLGRDLFSRLIWGTRTTLWVALIAWLVAIVGGTALGILSGLAGVRMAQFIDIPIGVALAFPGLLLALLVVSLLGRGPLQAGVAIGISLLPGFARVVASRVRTMLHLTYIEAARALGAHSVDIVTHHLIPNIAYHTRSEAITILVWAINAIVALEFLGISSDLRETSLGRMILDGRTYFSVAPALLLLPAGYLVGMLLLLMSVEIREIDR